MKYPKQLNSRREHEPSLQEVIGVTACAGIATAFDVEVQVENVSIGRSVVNDLNRWMS